MTFDVRDKVRIYNPRRYQGRSPKWQLHFKDVGTVQRKLNNVTYVIKSPAWKTPKVIHVDKLRGGDIFSQLSVWGRAPRKQTTADALCWCDVQDAEEERLGLSVRPRRV